MTDTLSRMRIACLCPLFVLAACDAPTPLAGIITEANVGSLVPAGEAAYGRVGDYYLKNDVATFILQRPGTEISLGPYGGSLIDAALSNTGDTMGELIPILALGRTVRIQGMEVISDGSDGGRAVVEAKGVDATNLLYNLEGAVPSLLSYVEDGSGVLGFDPDASMGLAVRVRYALEPGEARLSVTYTFTNLSSRQQGVPLGFLVDTRATGEPFMPGAGFGPNVSDSLEVDSLFEMLGYDQATSQLAFVTHEAAVSFVPRRLGTESPPRAIGMQIPMLGSALLLNARTVGGALKRASFTLEPGESNDARIDVVVAPTLSEALQRGWELTGQELARVEGCVRTNDGEPAAHVRVGLLGAEESPVTAFDTGNDGCFSGMAPPGQYHALAGHHYRSSSAWVALEVPGSVQLTLAPLAGVDVDVQLFNTLDATSPTTHPCRVELIGERALVSHPALGGAPYDDPGGIFARQALLRHCRGHFEVVPGRYLAVVTRGPEFEKLETVIEVSAGANATIAGALRRVVDTRGYAASDFHVHSAYSSDSMVPAEERALSIAAEGLDFWVSTDHDVVTDFVPHIEAMGLEDDLMTISGEEVSTFDMGHFNAYPMPYDPTLSNGGAINWAGDHGVRPTFTDLFESIHDRGALVQVNHPRSSGIAMSAYFTRAGLRYDPVSGQPYGDPALQVVGNEHLRFAVGTPLFAADFDIIEVMNGTSTYVYDDMVYDRDVEREGHDWMNMLSVGIRLAATANSDTHTTADWPGTPRTMVNGHDFGTTALVEAVRRGDMILTTGPMVRAVLIDAVGGTAGLGEVLAPASNALTLRVEVETPAWFTADRVEVIANAFFEDPTSGEPMPRAVPLVVLTPEEIIRNNGGRAQYATTDIELDLLSAPFDGRDSWIVVRVGGPNSLVFGAMQCGGNVDVEALTPEAFLSERYGVMPFAMTNPIFVDSDNDGVWRGPIAD